MSHDEIDEVLARRVAGVTLADVRTVRKVMRGELVRGHIAQRIQAALDKAREKKAGRV
jgi:hypothetical protein